MEQYDILILTLVGSVTSIMVLTIKIMYKSKCTQTDCCCGLIRFKRDVKLETELEEKSKNNKPPSNTIGNISEVNLQQINTSVSGENV